jgi:hypothetical protein
MGSESLTPTHPIAQATVFKGSESLTPAHPIAQATVFKDSDPLKQVLVQGL